MNGKTDKATIIYLDSCMMLSRKAYSSWREIQEEFGERYKSSLEPMTCDEIIEFFACDFGHEEDWPFSRSTLIGFFEGNYTVIKSEE